jgi:uroporphyrinogen-III synthase
MRVLLVRADSTPDDDGRILRERGFDVTAQPFIEVAACADPDARSRARALLEAAATPEAWLIVTSAAGVRALVSLLGPDEARRGIVQARDLGARFAAVGPTSSRALVDVGAAEVLVPERAHTASALLDALRGVAPATAVLPRSSVGDTLLPSTLDARGWAVTSQVVYESTTVATPPVAAQGLRDGEFDALVLRSPSAARAVARLAGPLPIGTKVIAGGPTTALTAQRLGIAVAAVARDSRPESIADSVQDALAVGRAAARQFVEVHA